MTPYKYKVIAKDGNTVSGVIEAYNEMDAVARLRAEYSVVVSLNEASKKSGAGSFLSLDIGGNKMDDKAFVLMCQQFSIMLKAGMPIARTVHLIANKMTDKFLKRILTQVADDVEGGRSLSASFAERGKKAFPVTFLETIRAGEEAGNLDTAFESISEHYVKQSQMKRKVKSALAYPMFVLVIAIVVIIVLMIKVVPTFIEMFDSYDQELPLITQALIGMSNFFRDNILIIIAVVAGGFIAYKLYDKTEAGHMKLAQSSLRFPMLGNIRILSSASEFANTMTMMLTAGLPMTKCVSITSRVIKNYYISTEVSKMASQLEMGHSLGWSLKDSGCLPDILNDMTAVGEESGELAQTLEMTAVYYDNELEQATQAALAKLEPAVLVLLGGFAAFIVAAIYIAMFDLYGSM